MALSGVQSGVCLIGFVRLAFEIVGEKDDAMQVVTIAELKVQVRRAGRCRAA
jgi:hypothetical protein